MEPERLQQIEQLFHAALALEGDERADFLRKAWETDESLRREVESLLGYNSKAETFIETPVIEVAAPALAQDEVQAQTTEAVATERGSGPRPAQSVIDVIDGRRIGPYQIVRQLGCGGMGMVYITAVQDRSVAAG